MKNILNPNKSVLQCVALENHKIECEGVIYEQHQKVLTYDDYEFWVYLGCYISLVLFAGMMSGLTLAIFSLDLTSLKVLQMAGSSKDKKYASRIMPLAARQYMVLCSLVLANALAVEAMPILLDTIANPIVAIVTSVTAVLIFGEVLPQAICGRYGLAVGYYFAWLVWTLIAALFIVSWPLSMILECLLGRNRGTLYRRAELQALVDIHGPAKAKKRTSIKKRQFNLLKKKGVNNVSKMSKESKVAASIAPEAQLTAAERLTVDEVLIIRGALDLAIKNAKQAMVKLDDVYMLSSEENIDGKKLLEILEQGHSRIPIYVNNKRENLEGVLLTKRLITADPNKSTPIREFLKDTRYFYPPYCVDAKASLHALLNKFQEGRSTHMSFVYETEGKDMKLVGVITLEDIIEELLQVEIMDETDVIRDMNKRIQFARATFKESCENSKKVVQPACNNNNNNNNNNNLMNSAGKAKGERKS